MKNNSLFMIATILTSSVLISSSAFSLEVIHQPTTDFSYKNVQVAPGQMAFGSKQEPSWINFLSKSHPFYRSTSFNQKSKDLEVFEVHAMAVVPKPIDFFKGPTLNNLSTLKKLNPKNNHRPLNAEEAAIVKATDGDFWVHSEIPFPLSWTLLINLAKGNGALKPTTTAYIAMDTQFKFYDKSKIEASLAIQDKIARLAGPGLTVDAMNVQSSAHINHIADFLTIVTLFTKLDQNHTLASSYAIISLKEYSLKKSAGIVTGRNFMDGTQPSGFRTKRGIGAGLKSYFEEFYEDMFNGLSN